MMDRRQLLSIVGLCALTTVTDALAQQPHMWRVGFLALPTRPELLEKSRFGGFARGMRELGFVEGRNLIVEWRFADGDIGQLDNLAAELVARKVDVMVAGSTPAIRAAQKATSTIPIVAANANDPLGSGFVDSFGRPGHNITGLSSLSTDLGPKIVEFLRGVVPNAARVAILANPTNSSNAGIAKSLQTSLANVNTVSIPLQATQAAEIRRPLRQ
jgi:putative ABC transport system substrate-binding protein